MACHFLGYIVYGINNSVYSVILSSLVYETFLRHKTVLFNYLATGTGSTHVITNLESITLVITELLTGSALVTRYRQQTCNHRHGYR